MIGSDRSNNLSFRLLRGAATRCLLVAVPLAIAPAVVLTSAVPAHAGSYTFQDIIDPLNPTFTQALGINGSGTIAGYRQRHDFQRLHPHPAEQLYASQRPPARMVEPR